MSRKNNPSKSRRGAATAAPYLPPRPAGLDALRAAAAHCRGCPLYRTATQTVFGEGAPGSRIVLVGEQPGDQEDRSGRPFVGPAGRLLDQALAQAGIDRAKVYVTNAVKHFKWVREGRRRIHQKPGAREIAACRPWLEAELAALRPKIVVALGATAAQALMGRKFRVTAERGRAFPNPAGGIFMATVHPSSILRGPPQERDRAFARFVADLAHLPRYLRSKPGPWRRAQPVTAATSSAAATR